MPYKRQTLQSHNTIVKAGNNSTLEIISPSKVDPVSGLSKGLPETIRVNYTQTHYTSQDLADSGVANGLTKLLISPLDSNGKEIPDFARLLQNKNTFVKLEGDGSKVSIKLAKIVMPDSKTPILARVFIGG